MAERSATSCVRASTRHRRTGIRAGDIITGVNGTPVKGSRELAQKIGSMPPGTSVKLDILRNGETKSLTLPLEELPAKREG